MKIQCQECKMTFNGKDEYETERMFNDHKCTVDYSRMSNEELLIKIKMNQLGYHQSDSGGGCQWYVKMNEDDPSTFFALTELGGSDIPRTMDEKILHCLQAIDVEDWETLDEDITIKEFIGKYAA